MKSLQNFDKMTIHNPILWRIKVTNQDAQFVECDVTIWPKRILQFTEGFDGFFRTTIEFGIQRIKSSETKLSTISSI